MMNKIKQMFLAGLVIFLSFLTGKVRIRPVSKKERTDSKDDSQTK